MIPRHTSFSKILFLFPSPPILPNHSVQNILSFPHNFSQFFSDLFFFFLLFFKIMLLYNHNKLLKNDNQKLFLHSVEFKKRHIISIKNFNVKYKFYSLIQLVLMIQLFISLSSKFLIDIFVGIYYNRNPKNAQDRTWNYGY